MILVGSFGALCMACLITSVSTGSLVLHCSTTSSSCGSHTSPNFLRFLSALISSLSFVISLCRSFSDMGYLGFCKCSLSLLLLNYSLSQRMGEIFESSEVAEKRAILNFVLQNPVVNDKKLEFTLRKPFDLVLQLADNPIELPG